MIYENNPFKIEPHTDHISVEAMKALIAKKGVKVTGWKQSTNSFGEFWYIYLEYRKYTLEAWGLGYFDISDRVKVDFSINDVELDTWRKPEKIDKEQVLREIDYAVPYQKPLSQRGILHEMLVEEFGDDEDGAHTFMEDYFE